jgi:hypothetical protein
MSLRRTPIGGLMASHDKFPQRWLTQLLSTDPADRPAADAAVRDLYVAGGFTPPAGFVWFDLRLCFRFGGFPGYDGADDLPREIETLREGLLEF